ncbi:Crp/Fnr family transcriptional regulator [Devosia sp. PTR5]|uniref:Crp/Fnr family transcriptional regulator n=1 Tax=Devosia oryzisoli TaxID=2774138 RepID=A0A927IUJ8_9HYPH|nr:Crp/Fnr family transcriptional regulator [Devosia oryzisoli]MBD8066933.1 Crp/Fnr family transcriptional regulator [Devosia oryzisoli]
MDEDFGPLIFRRLWCGRKLKPEDVEALSHLHWVPQSIAAKSTFNPGTNLCILASGLAVRQRAEGPGVRQMTAVVLPGDTCSYEFVTGSAPTTVLRALTDCKAMQASLEDVVSLVEQRPAILQALLSHLAVDHAVTEELVTSISTRSALERTAHFLCELEFRLRRMGLANNGQFSLSMTQAEIGVYLGLSAVHVNRTLQELRKRGALSTRGNRLTLDLEQMRSIAGFVPDYLTEATADAPRRFDA